MTTEKEASTKYFLYIDECGDQNLENYNPEFPVFTLCGFWFQEKTEENWKSTLTLLKWNFGTMKI